MEKNTELNNDISDFDRGVWLAVEHLVIDVDEPSFAKEIIQQVSISLEKAVQLVKETNYQPHKIINTLIDNRTWITEKTVRSGGKC